MNGLYEREMGFFRIFTAHSQLLLFINKVSSFIPAEPLSG